MKSHKYYENEVTLTFFGFLILTGSLVSTVVAGTYGILQLYNNIKK